MGSGHSTRTALLNYLSAHIDADADFHEDIFQDFIRHCMDFPHWSQKAQHLSDELRTIMHGFATETGRTLELTNFKWADDFQVIEVQSLQDWSDIVHQQVQQSLNPGENFRLCYDDFSKRLLALVVKPSGELKVFQFDRKFCILNGHLAPLKPELHLTYGPHLELMEMAVQSLEISPFVRATFRMIEGTCWGQVTRGYLFQRFDEIRGNVVEHNPKLFLTLKRIEQFFVSRESDPYYQSLVRGLERSIGLLRVKDTTAASLAVESLARAQTGLESVFQGDKLLPLLIRELQYSMNEVASPSSRKSTALQKEAAETWPKETLYDLTN
ncbi:MAG: hypothetical protein LW875_05465 [Proteobacteria bacterium]|nr:hypothetical protein [Pseudomonadota bacterium]